METHTIPAERVGELHAVRARAELASQQQQLADSAAEHGPSAPPAPIVLTPQAHRQTIAAVVAVMQTLGGQDVPAPIQQASADMTFAAAQKYGGDIPYFVEIMAFAGFALLAKASFFPPKAAGPAGATPPAAAAAQAVP